MLEDLTRFLRIVLTKLIYQAAQEMFLDPYALGIKARREGYFLSDRFNPAKNGPLPQH